MADEISLEITNQNSTKDNVVIQPQIFYLPHLFPFSRVNPAEYTPLRKTKLYKWYNVVCPVST